MRFVSREHLQIVNTANNLRLFRRFVKKNANSIRLKGWRGCPPADRNAVLDVMLHMSQIACDFPEIAELEINPLYVQTEGQGAYAIDVRGVVDSD